MNLFEYEIEYYERFGEHFPNMMISGGREIEIIQECLKTNESYKPEVDKDVEY